MHLRAAWMASGCDAGAIEAAPFLPAALLQQPVLLTCPCSSSIWQRSRHIMQGLTVLNPWVRMLIAVAPPFIVCIHRK